MHENKQSRPIDTSLLPESDAAVSHFHSLGGHLTLFSHFGEDPLREHTELVVQREAEFHEVYADFGPFFYKVVNGDFSLFRHGILFLIDISKRLLNSIIFI